MVHQKSIRKSVEFENRPVPKIPLAFAVAAFSFLVGGLFDSTELMIASAVIACIAVAASAIARLQAIFLQSNRL